jgi:hypothetical protein
MNTYELWVALRTTPCTKHHIGAVCAVDELSSITNVSVLPRIFIVNTDTHDQPGKHWVSLYLPQDGPVEFFDPLGKEPKFYSEMFVNFIFSHSSEFVYNSKRFQADSSRACGQFCLFYCALRCRGTSMHNILTKFSDDKLANDKLVKDFVKGYFDTGTGLSKKCQNCLSPDDIRW